MARQHAAAFAFFLLLSVAMTWPLARRIDSAVAWKGDPYINTWILDWDWYATFHSGTSLFNATIFYPARDSLAFSENLYGIASLLFPFHAAGVPPIAAHNIALLLGFATSGFCAYLLGHFISGGALAGIVAGIFYAFVPFRFTHLTHVQHVWGGTLPLLIYALLRYGERATWPRAIFFAAVFLFNGLCNIHWLLFGTIAIAATAIIVRPKFVPIAVCTMIAAALLAIFLQPYWSAGMRRSAEEALRFSATWSDWITASGYNRVYAALHDASVDPERRLFPGALCLVIGGVGLLSTDRRSLKIALLWILLGLFGSFGLNFVFHEFLFDFVPGFRAIRVPARWAAIAYVGLAMLVAMGTAMIARRRVWANALVAAAFVIELHAAPIRWFIAPAEQRPIDLWLRDHKPRAIARLPITTDGEYLAMLHATTHHRPMINGVSGFTPPEYARIAAMPPDKVVPELRRIGVSHVVIHADDLTDRAWLKRAVATNQLAFVRRFDGGVGGDWLFTIGGTPQPSRELEAMLRGELTPNEGTWGVLQWPLWWTRMTPRTPIAGWAFSPYGIRAVNVLLNNGAIRLPATVMPNGRFTVHVNASPPGVWAETDIQAEIIDGRGSREMLEDRWIDWP